MAAATPHAAAPPELRAGLEGLSLRKRRQKAEELGIPEAQIEAAEESDAPKEALLALLLAHQQQPPHAGPRAGSGGKGGRRAESVEAHGGAPERDAAAPAVRADPWGVRPALSQSTAGAGLGPEAAPTAAAATAAGADADGAAGRPGAGRPGAGRPGRPDGGPADGARCPMRLESASERLAPGTGACTRSHV
jgi:hypothetical protein